MTRRETLAAGVAALATVMVPSTAHGKVRLLAQADDPLADLLKRADDCLKAGDWEGRLQYLLKAWDVRYDAQGHDRSSQGLLSALQTAQRWNCKFEEAYRTAAYSAERYATDASDAWIWSQFQLAEASMDLGDFPAAARIIQAVAAKRKHPATSDWLAKVSITEFDFSYELSPDRFADAFRQGKVLAFIPRDNLPYQTAKVVSVTGARSYARQQKGEQAWLEVVPGGTAPIRVVCHVTQTPYSYWPEIKALQTAPCLPVPSDDPYLNESDGIFLNARSKELARPLRSGTQFETVRNTTRWCAQNLRYTSEDEARIVTSDDCLAHRKGVCNPIGRALTALLRENGIPARCFRQIGSEAHPAWHTSVEIRSPRPDADNVWFPPGEWVYEFPLHALMYLYPAVAPDNERAFPWEQFYLTAIESFANTNRQQYVPEAWR